MTKQQKHELYKSNSWYQDLLAMVHDGNGEPHQYWAIDPIAEFEHLLEEAREVWRSRS